MTKCDVRRPCPRTGPGLVVYRTSGKNASGEDSIDEYSRRLVRAMCAAGNPARYVAEGLSSARLRGTDPAWVLLQYMPFSYGRWGIAPGLVRDAVALRRRAGTPFALTVHEAWVGMSDWRSTLMGAYQRVQLRSLLRTANAVIVTRVALAGVLGRGTVHVPVGSNITPVATTAQPERERLGITDELVVALFGTGHPSRALDHAKAAIDALAVERGSGGMRVLNLGVGAPKLDVAPGIDVRTPGRLSAEEVSRQLWASDLLLLPLTDGVSTGRTTLMAALAHGLPVLGLRGASTDLVLIDHPEALALTPVGDHRAFARAAVELTGDLGRLRATGEAGRRLYTSRFDWPVIARRVMSALTRDGKGGGL